jgi:hypothetical protein
MKDQTVDQLPERRKVRGMAGGAGCIIVGDRVSKPGPYARAPPLQEHVAGLEVPVRSLGNPI